MKTTTSRRIKLLATVTFCLIFFNTCLQAEENGKWISLFNGENLEGWTPKIRGYKLGENFGNTFRVEEGLLKVRYDQYDKFDERFGHLFYKDRFSYYRLRIEYRFIGEQAKEGPGWAYRNSGAMLHGQDPETMLINQDFPVSIEAQLLGGNGKDKRTTLNLCTPGTNVVLNGKLFKPHCTSSSSKTYHGDQWVTVEMEVRGNEVIKHIIDGKVVLEYTKPQLDETDKKRRVRDLVRKNKGIMLSEGTISLQSESHPIDFRKVELMILEK